MPLTQPGGFVRQQFTNQIIGQSSGEDIIAGLGNDVFFIGQGAGDFNIADDVIGIGTGAAGGPSTGVGNEAPNVVVIGNDIYVDAMLSSMDGSVIIGHRLMNAAPRNANVEKMVVIGSGFEDDTGIFQRNCVLIGVTVAASLTPGNANLQGATMMGANAGANPSASMSNSVFIGFECGRGAGTATSSSANTAIGTRALQNAASPANTIAIGFECMGDGGATANINLAIGLEAFQDATSGQGNIAIGNNTIGVGFTTQDNMIIIGDQSFPAGGSEKHIMLGHDIDMTVGGAAINTNGCVFIGNSAGANGGFIGGIAYLCIEGGSSVLGTPDTNIPFLLGDLDNANLMLGEHHNIVSGLRLDGGLGNGTNTFIIQDADAGGGGGGAITGGLSNSCGIFYDSSQGANGELRAIDPAGTVITLAVF